IYAMRDRDVIKFAEGRWSIDAEEIDNVVLSASVTDILISKIDHLSSSYRDVLRKIAVFGNNFDERLLCKIFDIDDDSCIKFLGETQKLHLIDRTNAGKFRFSHDKI